jgi:acyl-CoA reductase-like NAD-dependent aldehyde dehydrogenase
VTEPISAGPLIGGVGRKGSGPAFDVVDPYRGTVVAHISGAGLGDLDAALELARESRPMLASMSRARRAEILESAADSLARRSDEIAVEISRQIGKSLKDTRREVSRSSATLRASAAAANEGADRWLPADGGPGGEGLIAFEIRVPVGVVGAISPFNAPLNLSAHKVGAAIAAGNTVVLKPSSRVPLAALRLGEAFLEAGLPPGALAILPGDAALGQALVAHPSVNFVSFTGGRAAGAEVRRAAGAKRLSLELGGNAAAIVHNDANIPSAAQWLIWGAFGNAGQSCNSAQRIFVHEARWDQFLSAYVTKVKDLRVGDPLDPQTDVGSLVTETEARRVEGLVTEAVGVGAHILTGGTRSGASYAATILTDVPETHPIACNEVFGPVVLLYRYSEIGDAITRANSTDYGLTGAVFTSSLAVASRVSRELETGVVNVNRSPNYRLDHLPYGGVKSSGIGREGPRFAVEEMSERRLVLIDPNM